jgi:hypothetical protein
MSTLLRDPSGGMGINVQAEDSYAAPVWPDDPTAQTKMMHFEIEVADPAGHPFCLWSQPSRS